MSWHTPERKLEQAIKAYFVAVSGNEFNGVQIATRFSNAHLAEPRIEIICDEAQAFGANTSPDPGLWRCRVNIRVVSHYAPGVDGSTHDELSGQVSDKLLIEETATESLAIEINKTQAEGEFQITQTERGNRRETVDDHSLITEQEWFFLVVCRHT